MENTIELLPHNQKMFDDISKLIEDGERSILFSEATGLGKSFIFMAIINKYFRGERVLYVVPKVAIWYNLQSYKEFDLIKDYVTMTTYADFNIIKDHHYEYDAIFIDECHHLLSDIQGQNIVEICNKYVNEFGYVFGFTATPEIGRKRINCDKFFTNKVYGMDITQAIENGIFNKIKYAIADPDTIIDDAEYCKRYSIDGTKTLLENILSEHQDKKRWLVYFSNIAALNKNLPSLKKLFPDFKLFIMHNKMVNNEEQLSQFNSCTEKSMLLTVSMVLEGIHPKNVEGIMLYRNVENYHTLVQILGRVCDIKTKRSPVCLDVTNCIENITPTTLSYCIKDYNKKYKNKKGIKSIIDIKSSTYRYIELLNVICNKPQTYRGITWITNKELSLKLNMSECYVTSARKSGKSYEEIIDHVLDGNIRTYRGITWRNNSDLCIKLGKNNKYVGNRRKKGESYEEIIDRVLDDKPKTYRGITWRTGKDLSNELGIKISYIMYRRQKYKESYEEIIDHVLDGKSRTYRGITWETDVELSLKLNMSKTYVKERKTKYNETCEEIIDYVLDKQRTYRGITWETDVELCRKLGKSRTYVSIRKFKHNETYEEIIDSVLDKEGSK